MVNPDVVGELDSNGVSADKLLDDEVADDDVGDGLDCEAEVGEDCRVGLLVIQSCMTGIAEK